MKRALKCAGLMAVGFALYPLAFVPLGLKLCPGFMEWWIQVYADYLRLVGF